ncbi:MAG: anthrax toxin-like adenylyl cyclase domain-containing protein, partial [Methylobacter sp.]|nr:anthrax toxin-like adenylyl cyclase domain-containing protein [Methylobacter sp.]
MIIRGIRSSWEHDQNGMTYQDMADTKVVANKLGVVIVFRSTGPWAKRWLERGYPSKNFHVKGKSSDWGPQAGFVPFDGFFSKVGYDKEKAMKGTAANIDGLESGFAAKAPLVLTAEELKMQLTEQSGGRTAIKRKTTIAKSH